MFLALARRQSQRAMNMAEMVDRLGLESLEPSIVANLIASATPACSWCGYALECRQWLDRTPGPLTSAPDFCPNRPKFEMAKAQCRSHGRTPVTN